MKFRNMTEERKKLAEDNIKLAYFVAGKYKSLPIEFEEIQSEALLGLTKAAMHFNYGSGLKFSTFAVRVISNEILHYLRRQKGIGKDIRSLNEPIFEDGEVRLYETIPVFEDGYGLAEMIVSLKQEMKKLNKKERELLALLSDNPCLTQREVAGMMGVKRSAVSEMLKKIRKKIQCA